MKHDSVATLQNPLCGVLCSRGACVSANFGGQPFRFALDDMLAEERAQQESAVQQCAPPGLSVLPSWASWRPWRSLFAWPRP